MNIKSLIDFYKDKIVKMSSADFIQSVRTSTLPIHQSSEISIADLIALKIFHNSRRTDIQDNLIIVGNENDDINQYKVSDETIKDLYDSGIVFNCMDGMYSSQEDYTELNRKYYLIVPEIIKGEEDYKIDFSEPELISKTIRNTLVEDSYETDNVNMFRVNNIHDLNEGDIIYIDFGFLSDEDYKRPDVSECLKYLYDYLNKEFRILTIELLRGSLIDKDEKILKEKRNKLIADKNLHNKSLYDLNKISKEVEEVVLSEYRRSDYYEKVKDITDNFISEIGEENIKNYIFYFSEVADRLSIKRTVQKYLVCFLSIRFNALFIPADDSESFLQREAFSSIRDCISNKSFKTLKERISFLMDLPGIFPLVDYDYSYYDIVFRKNSSLNISMVIAPFDNIRTEEFKKVNYSSDNVDGVDNLPLNMLRESIVKNDYNWDTKGDNLDGEVEDWYDVKATTEYWKEKLYLFESSLKRTKYLENNKNEILDFTNVTVFKNSLDGDKLYIGYALKLDFRLDGNSMIYNMQPPIEVTYSEDDISSRYIPLRIFESFLDNSAKEYIDNIADITINNVLHTSFSSYLKENGYDIKEVKSMSSEEQSLLLSKSIVSMRTKLKYAHNYEISDYGIFVNLFTSVGFKEVYQLVCFNPRRTYEYMKYISINKNYKKDKLSKLSNTLNSSTMVREYKNLVSLFGGLVSYDSIFLDNSILDLNSDLSRRFEFVVPIMLTRY